MVTNFYFRKRLPEPVQVLLRRVESFLRPDSLARLYERHHQLLLRHSRTPRGRKRRSRPAEVPVQSRRRVHLPREPLYDAQVLPERSRPFSEADTPVRSKFAGARWNDRLSIRTHRKGRALLRVHPGSRVYRRRSERVGRTPRPGRPIRRLGDRAGIADSHGRAPRLVRTGRQTVSAFAPATVVIYDADCRFCIRSLRVLKAFDILGRVSLLPSDTQGLLELFPSLRGADFSSAMYAVRDGAAYAGFDAFRTALWSSPILALLAWSWYVPPVPAVGRRLYAWIARNRHSLGCSIES